MIYHQISDDDLAELERIVPDICWAHLPNMTPRIRVQGSRAQAILSNVRWNYWPPREIETIEVDEPPEQSP